MEVIHHPADQRFVLRLPEGDAVLEYFRQPDGTLDIVSTTVPAAARGRGWGGQLARAALDHARAQGVRIVPSCGFVARWVAQHPEFQDLLPMA
jgi:hypothetical protein